MVYGTPTRLTRHFATWLPREQVERNPKTQPLTHMGVRKEGSGKSRSTSNNQVSLTFIFAAHKKPTCCRKNVPSLISHALPSMYSSRRALRVHWFVVPWVKAVFVLFSFEPVNLCPSMYGRYHTPYVTNIPHQHPTSMVLLYTSLFCTTVAGGGEEGSRIYISPPGYIDRFPPVGRTFIVDQRCGMTAV